MPNSRRVFLALIVLAATACSATCFAQTPATFRTQTYTERPSESAYAVDVNNDGVLDLVQFLPPIARQAPAIAFTVRIANGNGSFRDPVVHSFSPPNEFDRIVMVSGDFNDDGNVDLAVGFNGGDQLMLFLGKGDGTFQGKDVTIALPSGQKFGILFPAADFNGDGKLDLVATTSPTGSIGDLNSIYLIPGDGKGNFGNPALLYMSTAKHLIDNSNIAAGDFDGDGRADVAFLDDYNCDQGFCSSTLHVLYNDGDSRFTDTATFASFPDLGEEFNFSAGDLNSDGRTDIFGIKGNNSNQLEVLYGQADRTFHIYDLATPTLDEGFAMADFNGDTRMDLVALDQNGGGTAFQLQFFLADSGEGTFTQQAFGLPNMVGVSDSPLVGDFNSDTRPDVISLVGNLITPTVIADTLNTTSSGNWGGCVYPAAGMGIMVCTPGPSSASPVTFKASANSFGQLRKIELWVDGKKITEQHHTWGQRAWFNFSGTFAPGPHNAVMYAADIDNRLQKTAFTFTVAGGAACSAPTSPSVNICLPANGSTVRTPVQVEATATVTGTIASTQLWVDGVKKFSTASSTLTTSISVAAGSHRFAVIATNTTGQKWESVVNATVK